MRIHASHPLALTTLGLLTLAFVGCGSDTAETDSETESISAAAKPTIADAPTPVTADSAPGLPESRPAVAIEQSVDSATKAVGTAVDDQVRQTAQKVETAIGAPPSPDASALPALIEPVIEAAKSQVNQAAGELGQGVQKVTDGLKEGVRQTTDELTQGLREKSDALGQKARDEAHKTTSSLLNRLNTTAKDAAKQGINKAKIAVKDVAPKN